jgi:hypothetical protein
VIRCDAVGKPGDVANVKSVPAQLPLTSMERGTITVSFAVPADDPECGEHELLVWVRGCKNHYVRWTVSTARRGVDSCHQIDIEDGPDPIHHWYDHFYCNHPCIAGRQG